MKKKRLLLISLLIMSLIIGTLPVSASGETKQLKDLSPGSIVYDSSWQWEHKTENGYTGSGTTKSVEWIVVTKNHTGYPSNSVTLLSNELIGKYYFDNSRNRGSEYGSNHWGDSGTGNANYGIRKFLNGTSYTGNDSNNYPISFFNTFSDDFKDLVLETTLNMKTYSGGTYTSKDKVFLPSENELGGSYTTSDGSNWEYFSNNNSRIAKIGSTDWYYRTRSPNSGSSNSVRIVNADGSFSNSDNAYSPSHGVRPALNLKSDTLVKSVAGKWQIVHEKPDTTVPSITLTQSTTGPTNQNITITATATDPTVSGQITSEVKRIQKPDNSWVNGSTTTHIVTANGTYEFKAEDNAGNIGTKSITISNIDKIKPTKPTLSATPTTPTNGDVTVTVVAGTDTGGSGVDKTEYRIGTGAWTTYSVPFKVSSNSTIEARAKDKAGNVSELGSIIISNINTTLPIITIEPYDTEWTNKDITVTATVDKGILNKESHIFTKNGSFTFKVTDEYGNTSEETVTITNIDKIKPKIKITVGN